MKFTLRQLDVFLAIANIGNVSKAAQKLAMSQSACSSALKDLEHQFDTQLFDRDGKRLKINEQGRRLRTKAQGLLAQAHEIEDELIANTRVGSLDIGATLTIGNYLCVSLIDQFMRQFPGSKVALDVANTHNVIHKILNFDIDLGMIEGETAHPDIELIPWQEDELVCFCSPAHPLAQTQKQTQKQTPKLTEETFSKQKWIMREQGSGTRQTFDNAIGKNISQLTIALELQHTEAIKKSVEANIGIACLSKISLEDAFKRGTLVPIVTPYNFMRHFYIALHTNKYRSAGIKEWLTLCGIKK